MSTVKTYVKGDRVRMSEALKKQLRGKCGEAGQHIGPFDTPAEDCWGCSTGHVEEFGDCIGVVDGLVDYNYDSRSAHDPERVGPELDVRWQPSNLRYAYHPNQLIPADDVNFV